MKPAAFLFDLDGTLIDSELLWTRAIVDWLASYGQSITVDALMPIVVGHSWMDIHSTLHAHFPALPKTSAIEDSLVLRPYYNRLVVDPQKLVVPSAVAFFKKAARLAPCAIVSGSPRADVLNAAELCGISGLVRLVLGGEEYGRGKPAPDGYLKAASLLDVDASECVVLEDSAAGVISGRAAGMHVVGIDRNRACPQNLVGCDWLVHDLSELDIDAVFGEKED